MQDWTRKKINAINCKKNVSIESLWLFITGGVGVWKSQLMKIICMFFIKTMKLYSGSVEKLKVLIFAPTWVAAININGTTINSGLSTPWYVKEYTWLRLSDSERAGLHNLYFKVA